MEEQVIRKTELAELIRAAVRAREGSYCPYSGFAVGAALQAKDGSIFTGCNIENAAFSPTCCAERVAFFKAVSGGVTEFERIVVVGGRKGPRAAYACRSCWSFVIPKRLRSFPRGRIRNMRCGG